MLNFNDHTRHITGFELTAHSLPVHSTQLMMPMRDNGQVKILPASWDVYHFVDINYSFSYGFLSVAVIVFDGLIQKRGSLSLSLSLCLVLRAWTQLFFYAHNVSISVIWTKSTHTKKINHVINFYISAL